MKYSAVLLAFAAGVFALPQEASSVTAAPASSVSPALRPEVSCVLKCDPKDVTCQAACVGVARPNPSQIAQTNECARNCDQGDGSKEATEKFAKCQQDCYASFFPSSQTAGNFVNAPAQTASGTGSQTNSAAPTGTGSPTGTAASASQTPGAANANNVKLTGAGIAGLALAIFAL